MRIIQIGLLMLAVVGTPVARAEEDRSQPPSPLDLETLIQEALERNPELKAANEEWRAARLRVPQASALPDPTVGYAIMGSDLETRVGPQMNVYEAEQMVPFPGKLWEKHRMASAEATAAQSKLKGTEREIIRKVSDVYYDLYAIDAISRTVEEIRDILKKFQSVASARYGAQGGSQRDVAKAQAEVSDTLQRLFILAQRRQTAAALLNALLDRDPHTPVGVAASLHIPNLTRTLDELLTLAKRHRPELHEASAMVARSQAANTLAKLEYVPDVSVGFQYSQIGAGMTTDPKDGRDAWMVPLKITVPLWQNRLLPGVLEAKRHLKASQARLSHEENTAEYDVKDAYYRFTSAKQVVELYDNALIPEAELAFRSDQAGYQASRQDVLNLIDSERVYLNAKVAYYQAVADTLKSFAELERAVGTTLAGDAQ